MFAGGDSREKRRLSHGDVVEGTVIQIGSEGIFLDVGAPTDACIDRSELEDAKGELRVKVGDRLKATVVDAEADVPQLTLAVGRGGAVDISQLETAFESKLPVSGRVSKAVKAGLEIDIGGVRAFCPASQVEVGHTADLEGFVGSDVEVLILELKEGGRNVIVSRRALLESQKQEVAEKLAASLTPGTDMEGVVRGTNKHGAIVDLGGLDGFVHVSELAYKRVGSPDDVVSEGDRVSVRILAIEQGEKGLRVRLSMKALMERDTTAPKADEVLEATVVKHTGGGVIVSTSRGEGLVPASELGLATGADHRRACPIGKVLSVVAVKGGERMRFSVTGVARVEERKNYREFGGRRGSAGASLGSFGDLFRKQLGLPEEAPDRPAPSASKATPAAASTSASGPTEGSAPQPTAAPTPQPAPQPAAAPSAPPQPRKDPPPGVIRRKR